MNMLSLCGIIILICIAFAILNAIGKAKHPFKKSITTMLSGVVALAIVNLVSPFTCVSVPVSVVSVLTAVAGGIPGVTLILALNAFF